jgi:hypothetical protein
MPDDRLAVDGKRDGEIVCGETAAAGVGQLQGAGSDGGGGILANGPDCLFELRHTQAPIQKNEGCMVFEFAVLGPLHANQLRCQHGEARLANRDHRLWTGDGVGDFTGGLGMGGRTGGRDRCVGLCRRSREAGRGLRG